MHFFRAIGHTKDPNKSVDFYNNIVNFQFFEVTVIQT